MQLDKLSLELGRAGGNKNMGMEMVVAEAIEEENTWVDWILGDAHFSCQDEE